MLEEKPKDNVMEQATEWYWTIREPDVSEADIADWQAWLTASSHHRRAFERVETALGYVDGIESPPWPTEEELVRDRYDGEVPIAAWQERHQESTSPTVKRVAPFPARYQYGWAVAATVLLGAVLLAFYAWRDSDTPAMPDFVLYQTEPAEHRDVLLPDGSSISLGGKSTVSVAYRRDRRMVVLQEGEAFFDVARDPSRPFTVSASERAITALGTAFNVARQGPRVVVTVTEGVVVIAPESELPGNQTGAAPGSETARLEAGHKIVYEADATLPISVTDPTEAIAWRKGLLKYRGEPLRFVIEDVNRYVTYPIAITDAAAGLLFTGTVFQDSADSWIFGLEDAFPVVVTENPQGTLIKLRSEN